MTDKKEFMKFVLKNGSTEYPTYDRIWKWVKKYTAREIKEAIKAHDFINNLSKKVNP